MILVSFFVEVAVRVIFELESFPQKSISIGFGEFLTRWNHRFQNIAIFFEGVIDVANQIIARRELLIIESISTLIITEFLVDSTQYGLPTIQTCFSRCAHKQKVMS